MENIKIGYIGLGCRGKDLLENIVLAQKEQVVAVCDVYEDRAREGAKVVEAAGQPTPFVSTDYKDIIANEEVNTIIIVTAWESHVEIALAAIICMLENKCVGISIHAHDRGGAVASDHVLRLSRNAEGKVEIGHYRAARNSHERFFRKPTLRFVDRA